MFHNPMHLTHDETVTFRSRGGNVTARVRIWQIAQYRPVVLADFAIEEVCGTSVGWVATYAHNTLLRGRHAEFMFIERAGDRMFNCLFLPLRHALILEHRTTVEPARIETHLGCPLDAQETT